MRPAAANPTAKQVARAPGNGRAPKAVKAARSRPKPAKPTSAETGKAAKPAEAAKASKPAKPPKVRIKLVRDGFTMPETDFSLIATLKARALAAAREAKKSELLRAGLHALAAFDTPRLIAMLDELQPVKTGRPKKSGD